MSPPRLNKKDVEPTTRFDFFCALAKCPEFWVLVVFIIVMTLVVFFALQESMTYFVYNRGGLL